jgi:curved DNA-binding protein CbpA
MVLYELLGLDSWKATKKEVKTAWRQKALSVHPDRATEEDREAATLLMQKLNAAVEVLSDRVRRRKYHEDGVLPWAL